MKIEDIVASKNIYEERCLKPFLSQYIVKHSLVLDDLRWHLPSIKHHYSYHQESIKSQPIALTSVAILVKASSKSSMSLICGDGPKPKAADSSLLFILSDLTLMHLGFASYLSSKCRDPIVSWTHRQKIHLFVHQKGLQWHLAMEQMHG